MNFVKVHVKAYFRKWFSDFKHLGNEVNVEK